MTEATIIFRPDPLTPVSKASTSPRVAKILDALVDGGLYGRSPAEAVERLLCERLGQLEDEERRRNPLITITDPEKVGAAVEKILDSMTLSMVERDRIRNEIRRLAGVPETWPTRWCIGVPDRECGFSMQFGPFEDEETALGTMPDIPPNTDVYIIQFQGEFQRLTHEWSDNQWSEIPECVWLALAHKFKIPVETT